MLSIQQSKMEGIKFAIREDQVFKNILDPHLCF